ncbi:alpha/beta hydrolase [Balneolaceae bacterium YR4-1]|uniref:Alpha/beta hydrolase n=1 Tax=Halalkalibaculum roseum TaxID=2709311 RepID=A0A6M1T5P3_9BACT|nr:alpha/beta hydrolase [Halalkalibaculum roseum]NGP78097.1 alpha/beta hydrolase [Halalkalibaculum roseum]
MSKLAITLSFIFLSLLFKPGFAQNSQNELDRVIFKTVDDSVSLSIYFTYPNSYNKQDQWPLIVFFHGGGWNQGSYKHFLRQAKYFSNHGFICALPEYRVRKKHNSTPFESLKDAKSALRFLKVNANKFQIDTSKVIAAGGSAGGHLAASLEMVEGYNEPTDDLGVDTDVDALVLFNGVLDNGPSGYGFRRVGKEYTSFSPFHQTKKGTAPTLILLGTDDNLIPVESMQEYCSEMKSAGSICKLVLYEGQEHGFFNRSPYLEKTIQQMHEFLIELELTKS